MAETLCVILLVAGPARGDRIDLTELSIEELVNVEITTVSKKEQRLFESPAAVYVITREDIRRSGARSIPEALRLAPGVQVARVDANKWVVTVRGFAGLFANKLLVLIDGRSVYTPLFSGVFWEAQDGVLEDVDRIEVVRGPGGALWGANAVNGIVNIITCRAGDTRGGFVQAGGGTEERGFGTVRYGGRLNERAAFRAYGKAFVRDASVDSAGRDRADDWRMVRAGGRIDWDLSAQSTFTLQGDLYDGEVGQALSLTASPSPPYVQTVYFDAQVSGGNVLGRWHRRTGDRSDLALQFYYDRAAREDATLRGAIHSADIDFQHRFAPGRRHEIVWGMGYRYTTDGFDGSFTTALIPESRSTHLFSGFVHHDISLVPDRLRLALGAKFEHNSYTGFEVQPNARVWWSPARRQALWGAVSRAVRTPSRGDRDFVGVARALPPGALFAGSPVALVRVSGNRDFVSETVLAFEGGYRAGLNDRLSLDVTAFHNRYRNLRTNEPDLSSIEVSTDPPHLTLPMEVDNKATGRSNGIELTMDWKPLGSWRLSTAYSFFRMDLKVSEDSFDTTTETFAEEAPEHQVSVRSYLDLPGSLELDVTGRYAGNLPAQNISDYLTLDARLGWHPVRRMELSLVGRNLVNSPHFEFISASSNTLPAQVEAGVYGMLNWRF